MLTISTAGASTGRKMPPMSNGSRMTTRYRLSPSAPRRISRICQASLDTLPHVYRNGRRRAIDLRHRVVDVRQEADPGTIGAAARGAPDAIVPVECRGQLLHVEGARTERDHGRRPLAIRVRVDVHAIDLSKTGHECLCECARAVLYGGTAEFRLKRERLAEADDRRLITLTHRFERVGNAHGTGIGADDARLDGALRFGAH